MTDNRTYTKREVDGIINLSGAANDYDYVLQALKNFKTDVSLAQYTFGEDADDKIKSILRQAERIWSELEDMREDLRDLRLEVGA